jgi:hypothetical protein
MNTFERRPERFRSQDISCDDLRVSTHAAGEEFRSASETAHDETPIL